jgi:RNA binding exosome subunit
MRLLPAADRMGIRDHIDIYYDGHSSLFLRVDKQSSYLGNPRLSSSDDVIRVKIGFLVRGKGLEAVLKLFELA